MRNDYVIVPEYGAQLATFLIEIATLGVGKVIALVCETIYA